LAADAGERMERKRAEIKAVSTKRDRIPVMAALFMEGF
jgi:hypothetical protein